MKKFLKSKLVGLLLLAVTAFWVPTGLLGQGSAGPVAGGTNYSNLESVFAMPSVTWAATGLTLNYTAGTIYPGTVAQAITAGTLTLSGSEGTCTVTAIQGGTDACDYVYWTSSTGLNTSTTFTTASAAANTILYACTATTVITGCVPFSLLPQITPIGTLHSVTGTGKAVLATNPTLTPLHGNTAAAATLSPTCAAQSGSMVFMGALTGEVVTLPAPAAGCSFDFIITVSNTSNYNEIETNSGSVFLLGEAQHCASGIACLDFWANGTSTVALKMDGAHLGGLIGSHFHVEYVSATQWEISGSNLGSATMTTAFSTSD